MDLNNYKLIVPPKLDKKFMKLVKKDKQQMQIIDRKINEILTNPHRFKPLRENMVGAKRVHIGKSFVLTFEVLENEKIVKLLDYDHHKKIYRK